MAIFERGDVGDAMYIVVESGVGLSVRAHDFEVLNRGEIFGETALIDAEPRFALHVMRVLARRLRTMDAHPGP